MKAISHTLKPTYSRGRSYAYSNTYRVFIVEDSPVYRQILVKYLQQMANCDLKRPPILEIYDFGTAEESMENVNLQPDIAILDYYLDENEENSMNGLQLLKKMKAKSPGTHFIILSAQESVMVTSELIHQGATEYISKEHSGPSRVLEVVLNHIKTKEAKKRRRNRLITFSIVLLVTIFIALQIILG